MKVHFVWGETPFLWQYALYCTQILTIHDCTDPKQNVPFVFNKI